MSSDPPRHGEGDQPAGWWRGVSPNDIVAMVETPLHHRFAAVPLPV
jgi:uncharacterized membrane protein